MAMRRFAHISLLSATNARKCFSTAPKTKSLPFFVSTKNARMCFSTVPNTSPPPASKDDSGVEKAKRDIIEQMKLLLDVKDDKAPKLFADPKGNYVCMDVVGFTNKDLNLEVKDYYLTIKGKTETESGPKQVDAVIRLPVQCYNPVDVTATIVNGELKVSFPNPKEHKNPCFSIVNWV